MSVLESLERLKRAELIDPDGEPVETDFFDGLSEDQLREIEEGLGAKLPHDFRQLAAVCGGFESAMKEVDLSGGSMGQYLPFMPALHPFAADGFGNFWQLDLLPRQEERAQVLFVGHDPPVVLFQCDGMEAFLDELLKMCSPPHESLIDLVHEDKVFQVCRTHRFAVPSEKALTSQDPVLREFAASLDGPWEVCDLRSPEVGQGFSWGRYGPDVEGVRHPGERIYAIRRPELGDKKEGWLSKLFGR